MFYDKKIFAYTYIYVYRQMYAFVNKESYNVKGLCEGGVISLDFRHPHTYILFHIQ